MLNINLIGKIDFYYSTSRRIDFRDLVRELFRIYKQEFGCVLLLDYLIKSHHQMQWVQQLQLPPQRQP